jgi:hypothetical protein
MQLFFAIRIIFEVISESTYSAQHRQIASSYVVTAGSTRAFIASIA